MTDLICSALRRAAVCTMFFSSFLLLLAGCSHCGEPVSQEVISDGSYFVVSLNNRLASSPLEQGELGEESVVSLAMLVFPSNSQERMGFSYMSQGTSQIPATYVRSGYNDIYFLANCPQQEVEMLQTREAVGRYLREQKSMPNELYKGASKSRGLPMARVYRDQMIPSGYTQERPFLLEPMVLAEKPLLPISAYGQDLTAGIKQSYVGLIRSVAKLSIRLRGEGRRDIVALRLVNVPQTYSLQQLPGDEQTQLLRELPITLDPRQEVESSDYVRFLPERLYTLSQNPRWQEPDVASGRSNELTYIELTTRLGRKFYIPIINNNTLQGQEYLAFAKSEQADYNIIRNTHYQLNISVMAEARHLEVTAKVSPWQRVQSKISFAEAVFTAEVTPVRDKTIEVEQHNIRVRNRHIVKISFKLAHPHGAIWRATLSNGHDFAIATKSANIKDAHPVVTGLADESTTHTIYIIPRRNYENTPRSTELIVTVNGEEIQVVKEFKDSNKPAQPGSRYLIRQVQ